ARNGLDRDQGPLSRSPQPAVSGCALRWSATAAAEDDAEAAARLSRSAQRTLAPSPRRRACSHGTAPGVDHSQGSARQRGAQLCTRMRSLIAALGLVLAAAGAACAPVAPSPPTAESGAPPHPSDLPPARVAAEAALL